MNWDDLVLVADELISEYGQAIKIRKVTIGEYDTDTGSVTESSTVIVTTGVVFDYGEKDINGTTILRGDKRVYIKPTGLDFIKTTDYITIGSNEYRVASIKTTSPAGINCLFDVTIRGSENV